MSFRYNPTQKLLIKIFRALRPSVPSAYTKGPIDDICKVTFSDPAEMQQFFVSCINLLKKEREGDIGDYLEFGVFNGTSMANMYFAAKEIGTSSIRQFGLDAFEGLPDMQEKDADVFQKGFYACSFEQLQECLRRKGVDQSNMIWIKGWYDEVLTPALATEYKINPGIIFIDCDTYDSSRIVLNFVAPLIKKPTIISLDDWRLYDLDLRGEGEYRSFNEFLESNPQFKAKEIPSYKRNSRSFLITLAH